MKRSYLSLIMIWLFLACMGNSGTNSEISTGGTSDETVVRTGAVIFEQDGVTPAKGATVKVFKTDAADGQYLCQQTTGSDGRYLIEGLEPGMYNIWVEKDSLVAFQDSVCISRDQADLHNDTLDCASSLTGFAASGQLNDQYPVTIQVIGTDRSVKAIDSTGLFTLRGMAGGKYSLLLKSDCSESTMASQVIKVHNCSNDTLKDTIRVIGCGLVVR